MARKQLGMVDLDLLDRVDERAAVLGQTRRVFVERALEAALGSHAPQGTDMTGRHPSASPRASLIDTKTGRETPVKQGGTHDSLPGRRAQYEAMCSTCVKAGPPTHKPCAKCGAQAGALGRFGK